MRQAIYKTLLMFKIEYDTKQSPAELGLLADSWADELKSENIASVLQALKQHRRESEKFPTLASIIKLLPECRTSQKQDMQALPQTINTILDKKIKEHYASKLANLSPEQRIEYLKGRFNSTCRF